ncbi:siphovirus Gp157 family protein [Aquamicrobium sp.]|uniref:siphovirus Gp157 family protein n=1 Tax=Aquamicrobium sp. TaxID=1872579 RepID=UPI00258AF1AD|nr:siphovirus Gp157 family protein [Aquamicrobium sp.]MCK9554154.1 siphovirus Gp157 family protein [Aquamicrobium sp.]
MSAITLYQLAQEYRADLDHLADLDLPPEAVQDTLESLGGELEVKAQNVIAFMRNLESTADAIKEAEKRMAERRKAIEKRADSLKQYVLDTMQHNGIQKIECPLFRISIAKNPPSVEIIDERQIPTHYLTDPPPPLPQIDKKLIAQAIKDGFEVPGAKLSQGYRLAIK